MSNSTRLTCKERLTLAMERISQEIAGVGVDPEIVAGLEAVLGVDDVEFAESLAAGLVS